MKEVGLGWARTKERLWPGRGETPLKVAPGQGRSDSAGSICHPQPCLHLSPGTGGWKLKSRHVLERGSSGAWAGRRGPCLTEPVHSLPGGGTGEALPSGCRARPGGGRTRWPGWGHCHSGSPGSCAGTSLPAASLQLLPDSHPSLGLAQGEPCVEEGGGSPGMVSFTSESHPWLLL